MINSWLWCLNFHLPETTRRTNSLSSRTDVGMAKLSSTLSTVAHRSPMLLAGSVSGQPHSNTIGRMYVMHAMRANNVPDKVIEKD